MPPAPPPTNLRVLRPCEHEDAARIAIDWLAERHRKGWRSACSALLDHWRPEGRTDGWELDDEAMTMVSINAGEWLLARGVIHARGGLREINGHVLGPEGPRLTPGQRAWIAQLRERPLRVYRVTDVRIGEGLTLVDELDPRAEPWSVREISASRSATPGLLMGARLMEVGTDPGATPRNIELSGALYPFAKLREAEVLARLRALQTGAAGLEPHDATVRDPIETGIARAWLAQWFEPAPLPQLHDAFTGDPILLVTDHYRLHDAARLAAALHAQPDVSGDAHQGWSRLAVDDDGVQRSLVSINPGRNAQRIQLFSRTQRLADVSRAWFEALAGSAVQHLSREIVDPVGSHTPSRRGAAARASDAAPSDGSGLPPEVLAQVFEQVIRRTYANWCDEAIPALDGRTPRQAITTAPGLERVKGLLRRYEDAERRQSAAQGRTTVSYQFLWDALGISR